jgi:hypothetical protein
MNPFQEYIERMHREMPPQKPEWIKKAQVSARRRIARYAKKHGMTKEQAAQALREF